MRTSIHEWRRQLAAIPRRASGWVLRQGLAERGNGLAATLSGGRRNIRPQRRVFLLWE
jgi:hypothetical protein